MKASRYFVALILAMVFGSMPFAAVAANDFSVAHAHAISLQHSR